MRAGSRTLQRAAWGGCPPLGAWLRRFPLLCPRPQALPNTHFGRRSASVGSRGDRPQGGGWVQGGGHTATLSWKLPDLDLCWPRGSSMNTIPACKEKHKNPGEAKAFPARAPTASPPGRFPFRGLVWPRWLLAQLWMEVLPQGAWARALGAFSRAAKNCLGRKGAWQQGLRPDALCLLLGVSGPIWEAAGCLLGRSLTPGERREDTPALSWPAAEAPLALLELLPVLPTQAAHESPGQSRPQCPCCRPRPRRAPPCVCTRGTQARNHPPGRLPWRRVG